jgi:polyphosphate kinase
MEASYFKRDISWLSFSRRILMEAADKNVPLVERIKFLSIFSSNLDEFYSVRIPILMALKKISNEDVMTDPPPDIRTIQSLIVQQMKDFGSIIQTDILPDLQSANVHLFFSEPIPDFLLTAIGDYFYNRVLGFLQPVFLSGRHISTSIQNNKLYLLVILKDDEGKQQLAILNIPTDFLPRFYFIDDTKTALRFIFFLEDIIKNNLGKIFQEYQIMGAYSIKITRDTSLDLKDEYQGDIAEKIEKQLQIREYGLPTRFLHEPVIPQGEIQSVVKKLKLHHANIVAGGSYHHLRELSLLPVPPTSFFCSENPVPKQQSLLNSEYSIFNRIAANDIIIHTPYQSYDPVLRFFNEAATDPAVKKIYLTIYRIASDSQITNALISAAKNGKKVTVFMELKARFDEANNLKWSKKMKQAGVKIIYSIPGLKVHAKIALVKRKEKKTLVNYGLYSTGNFNETTARFYTDHILLSANPAMSSELGLLFSHITHPNKIHKNGLSRFKELLVSQFNLAEKFKLLIQREIDLAKEGKQASIIIKLNNLEEKSLIQKLYEASAAGVNIQLIIRGICCLVPGVTGMSENISLIRIVDSYLEHGRVFIFNNNGSPEIFLGSADWMNRNIHYRVEVCFPVHDEKIKHQIIKLIETQLNDNIKGVKLNEQMDNNRIVQETNKPLIRSQQKIYDLL